MEPILSKIAGFVIIATVASVTAVVLGYVCHYNLGLSRHEIRTEALTIAGAMAAIVTIDYFGRKWREPK
jgi:hypothetical protein